ncbi:hypothetical protein ACFSTC_19235 [Nonomuraea ferruginea]
MHTARPVLLDLADRPELRQIARDCRHLLDVHTAKTDDRPADALLIRPDGHVAWAARPRRIHGQRHAPAARGTLRMVRNAVKQRELRHDQ